MYLPFVVAFLITFLVLTEIYFLGKYITIKQRLLFHNNYASFVFGFIAYFAFSFAFFYFFIIAKLDTIYLVALFSAKDLITIFWLIFQRKLFQKADLGLYQLGIVFMLSVGIVLIFNFGYNSFLNFELVVSATKDNSWLTLQRIIQYISGVDLDFILKWVSSLIVAIFALYSINSVFYFFAKNFRQVWQLSVSFLITLLIGLVFNFGKHFNDMTNIFLLPFAMLICVNIIILMRRRFAFWFALGTFTSWTFDSNYFFAMLIIGLGTIFVYTILKKMSVTIFWIQILLPFIIISTRWIDDSLLWLSTIMTIASFGLFLVIISLRKMRFLTRFDLFLIKGRFLWPSLTFASLVIASLIIIIREPTNMVTTTLFDAYYLFDHFNQFALKILLIITYVFTIFGFTFYFFKVKNLKLKINKRQFALVMSLIFIVFVVNPLFFIITNGSAPLSTLWTIPLLITIVQINEGAQKVWRTKSVSKTRLKNRHFSQPKISF